MLIKTWKIKYNFDINSPKPRDNQCWRFLVFSCSFFLRLYYVCMYVLYMYIILTYIYIILWDFHLQFLLSVISYYQIYHNFHHFSFVDDQVISVFCSGSSCMFVFWTVLLHALGDMTTDTSWGIAHSIASTGTLVFLPQKNFQSFSNKRRCYVSMLLHLLYHISVCLSILLCSF